MGLLTEQFKAHRDVYSCIGINIAHLGDEDKHTLDCAFSGEMVMERDTGWFVKLYEFDKKEEGGTLETFFTELYQGITPTLLTIFCEACQAGYRLIEFDMDALIVKDLPVFD